MSNLFSSFDPSSSMNLSLNWLSALLSILILPTIFWLIPSRISMMWNKILFLLNKEFKILLNLKNNKGSTLIFISLFTIILINNLTSLFPYVFSSTSHMTMNLSLALPVWLSFMLFGWINNYIHMFAHLVPQGTPPALMPFMVCIETTSNIIRPLTLAIRLTANIMAGHLLLTLLGNSGSKISYMILSILIISQLMLFVLESAVAMIQAYVFSILSTLYSSEVN
uniref:ATP synthase F0 subunit 6 n=1 Tax=Rhagonycha nigroimpressa TaxID=3027144 RepID=UPI0023D887CE|nr:ATP synthase F0 subunit 6 [Rhagonycha nigroimpressa]YP_010709555.1 ATP synthase F0 subunit 6 [Rhagonycha tibetana]YP_010709568.1 ATP synthase F0 subunit 6 [Rhagonycha tryznai]WDA98592.1 ATP synthase F0 subunit 6 [Rhagonycha bimucronata]WCS40138.1 ATP synthase F0 subunit 6 [Rhagonycha nigroimpressa]WCS40151.1 ATP synthase F0 subunit 6 [Rhagonycha tibetana]WCS40164.1 ATP synthase F0 subunit 6 [Rhagonycha tryznai]